MTARKPLLVAAVIAGAALVGAAPAVGISPREECVQAGGTFKKVQGTQTCTFTTTPGKNRGGVTKVEKVSQKGSSRSSHPEEEKKGVDNRGGFHPHG
jgi:hypothetical protein